MSETATETITPNAMPGAQEADTTAKPDAKTETKASKTDTTATANAGALSADERAELARLREVHKDEQKWRREATENHAPAEAYKSLLEALGVDGKKGAKDFDPKAAIDELTTKFNTAEQARIRSEVARTEGLDPEDFTGSTEEEMRESAKRFKARIEAEVAKRAPVATTAAAPAGEVTANGKVTGPQQVTSRDALKGMTRQQIIDAHKGGQLDDMAVGKAT